jgi:uncharacterized protein
MNVAVISDTHLPRGARSIPEACLERLRVADAILHAGDFTALGALEELESLGPPLHGVFGNMDDAGVRGRMPAETVVELGGARIGMIHDPGPAEGRGRRLVQRFPGCDAIVYGHTHQPEVDSHDGVLILNPGSPTERRRAPTHTMIVLEIDADRIQAELIHLT